VPMTLERGRQFFADIQTNQMDAPAQSLARLIAQGSQRAGALDFDRAQVTATRTTIDHLVRRELIERTGRGVRFQVELIRRWFVYNDM